MNIILDGSEVRVSKIPVEKLLGESLGSEISKWQRIESFLSHRKKVFEGIDQKIRLEILKYDGQITQSVKGFSKIAKLDADFLRYYIWEKMKDVLWGKGKSEIGYQDEAGIAHSELIAWHTLGFIDYPNFDFRRSDLESAYISTFIDIDKRDNIDLTEIGTCDLKNMLLSRKDGSESLAYYHSKTSINWKRLHNLPLIRKSVALASNRISNLIHDKANSIEHLKS